MKADLNNDGVVTETEADVVRDLLKSSVQKRLSLIAMWSMVIVTILLFAPIIPIERVSALADLLTMFYIAQASIVGAYMGVTAYMSKQGGSL
jgi:hypothetical protein